MLTKSSLLENVSQGRVFDGYLQKQNVQLVNPYWFTIRIPFCCRHGDIFRDHQYHGCAIYELFLVTPSRFSPTIYRHSINVSTFQILLPPVCEMRAANTNTTPEFLSRARSRTQLSINTTKARRLVLVSHRLRYCWSWSPTKHFSSFIKLYTSADTLISGVLSWWLGLMMNMTKLVENKDVH